MQTNIEWVINIEQWCGETKELLHRQEEVKEKLSTVQDELDILLTQVAEKQAVEEQLKSALKETESQVESCKARFLCFGDAIC